jgi:hypothetical protein
LQHCHYLFDAEVSCHLTILGFPYQLFSLALWNIDMEQMTQHPVGPWLWKKENIMEEKEKNELRGRKVD